MRCKNCGWDNPAGNGKCEKCNVPLSGSMVDERTPSAENSMSEDFNPAITAQGCPSCGYPLRPTDTVCPNCFTGARPGIGSTAQTGGGKNDPDDKHPPKRGGGTVIGGTVIGSVGGDEGRRKLVGFLVTYTHVKNGEFYPLYEGKNFLGRDVAMDVCIYDDAMVSDKHLSILYRVIDRKFKFKDEQSTNGTFINGELIDEGELKNFDKLSVGLTKLIFIAIPLNSD